jgi:hypothetical protein
MQQRTKKKKRQFNRSLRKIRGINCSASLTPSHKDYSCYSDESLLGLKNYWNRTQINTTRKIQTNNPREIHSAFNNYLHADCGENELCWLKQKKYFNLQPIDKLYQHEFAPFAPKSWKTNDHDWLYDSDIFNVMKSFERAYPCFAFIGPTSIDFDKYLPRQRACVLNDLCRFSLPSFIKKKKHKIGMVFNTDPHDKPGKHWISLFINIRNETITYFDSAAKPTPREINVFMDRVIEQGLRMKPAIRFRLSPAITTQHQIGNSECGIYSLFFIINMLEDNIDSYFLNNNIIRDKDMHAFRQIYFNMPI